MDYVEVRYGGAGPRSIHVAGAADVVAQPGDRVPRGMRIEWASPVISDCQFLNNAGAAISMNLASDPAITGGTMAGNAINGVLLDGLYLTAPDVGRPRRCLRAAPRGTPTPPADRTLFRRARANRQDDGRGACD